MKRRLERRIRCGLLAALAWVGLTATAGAATIASTNISLTVDDVHGGLVDYVIGGQDQLNETQYYYRTGTMTAESQFIGLGSTNVTSVNVVAADRITVIGSTPEFDFQLDYVITINEEVVPKLTITNTSGAAMNVAIYSYQDWDVKGNANGDRLVWDGNTMTASHGSTAVDITPLLLNGNVQASASPVLLNILRDTAEDDLDGSGLPFGPGNGTFALQWNAFLTATDVFTATYFVPEPEPILMLAPALLGLFWLGHRRPRA